MSGGRPGALLEAEILEQPEMLARQLACGPGPVRQIASAVRDFAPRAVLLAGRGTSDHAALYAKYLVETRFGMPCGLASLSTLTGYHATAHLDGVLWIAVSQSGGSPDLVEATAAAGSAGALTLAVTNGADNPLRRVAGLGLDIAAGPELSVAASKTYSASLLALWLLVDAWSGGDGRAAEVLPTAVAEACRGVGVEEVAERYRFVDRLITVGRGFSYPTAREAALKLMETTYISAHAFSGADLLHGPLAMVDRDRPVVVISPGGVGSALLRPVLVALADRGADVTLVGDRPRGVSVAVHVPLPHGVPEELAPIVQIVPMQVLALRMARARGVDPDRPRGLRKETQTR